MVNFDSRILQKNLTFPKGSIIINSKEKINKLNYISKGTISFFFENISNQDKFVFQTQAKNVLLPSILLTNEDNFLKIIASDYVEIDSYPFQINPITFFKQNSSFTKVLTYSILTDFNSVIRQIKSFMQIYFLVERIFDNFLIFLGNIGSSILYYNLSNYDPNILSKIDNYKNLFVKNGGFFPQDFKINFFDDFILKNI